MAGRYPTTNTSLSPFVWILLLSCFIAKFASSASSGVRVSEVSEKDPLSMSISSDYLNLISNLGRHEAALEKVNKGNEKNNNDLSFGESQVYFKQIISDSLSVIAERLSGKTKSNHDESRTSGLLSFVDAIKVNKMLGTQEDSSCSNDTGRIITSLLSGEYWAIQFFDATGKPGPSITRGWWNFVGSYDQCMEASAPPSSASNSTDGFKGNYCNLQVAVPVSPFPAQLGMCLPSTCSPRQIENLFKSVLSLSNVTSVSVAGVQCMTTDTSVTTATVIAIIMLCLLVSLAILGTWYDVVYVQNLICSTVEEEEKDYEFKEKAPESNAKIHSKDISGTQETNVIGEGQPLIPKLKAASTNRSLVISILLAFSVYSNGKKLLKTSQPAGSLGSIHGIRFVSMTWVVLGHCYIFGGNNFTVNFTTEILDLMHRWTFDAVFNGLLSVDTFFALSGLLTSYLTIPELMKRGLRINWVKFYCHRLWRLTPPYMIALVTFLGLQQYFGQGPLWNNEQPADKQFCEKRWWTNLLYINNFIKPDEMCFVHSWYLANDMQFFAISPLMLIPFCFHWLAGVGSCAVVILISWITTGVLSAQYHWGDTILSATENHWFCKYYVVPWCRIGPYVVGIMAGYLLALTKGQPFRLRRWVVLVGWVVATGSALAVVYGIDGDFSREPPSSWSANALYNSVARTVWGACVCWVIVACAAGYGGPVNALLSWSPFVMLGRLTYMTYLFHLNILQIFFGNMGGTYYGNDTTMAVLFLGLLTFCNMAAFVGALLIESPMMGLEKIFLPKGN